MFKLSNQWKISIFSALVFFIVASPFLFRLVDALTSPLGVHVVDINGAPTYLGLLIHALVFMLIVRYTMDLKLF